MGKRGHAQRRVRVALLWATSLLLLVGYFLLPGGEDPVAIEPPPATTDSPTEPRKFEVVQTTPTDGPAGSAVVISYAGVPAGADESQLRALAGPDEMVVLDRRPGSLVARLPGKLEPGRLKIRVAVGEQRSKSYDFRIKIPNWRKRFGNLVGGFALLVFGIGVFGRGVREVVGLRSARTLERVARRPHAALGLGALVGALVQSTTAAAGLLAGLVGSSLLSVAPAATAFLGAQIGAATAPLLVTGVIDPRGGLVVVAIGVLWLGFAFDRRSTALGRFALGAGLIAFGMQVLRPGFEPFVTDPALLPFLERLRADSALGVATCALLGAALVAALQSPAPVLVVVLGLAQTTGQWDLRTALALLSGSGLGAALGALLTTPAGARSRRLAQVNLLLGATSTAIGAATVNVWSMLADRLVAGEPHQIQWGRRVLLPNLGPHLTVAFALSQLAIAVVLVPLVPWVTRSLDRIWPQTAPKEVVKIGDPVGTVRAGLLKVLRAERDSLQPLSELALAGVRSAGITAEHCLNDAHAMLETLLSGPVHLLPAEHEGEALGRVAFGCLQLERSLESALRLAERLTDRRMEASAGTMEVPALAGDDEAVLREMQRTLFEGMEVLEASLETRTPVDLEAASAREIELNGLEAKARSALLTGNREPLSVESRIGVVELVDAYETAGNQVYRLAQALSETFAPAHLVAVV